MFYDQSYSTLMPSVFLSYYFFYLKRAHLNVAQFWPLLPSPSSLSSPNTCLSPLLDGQVGFAVKLARQNRKEKNKKGLLKLIDLH